MAVATQIDERMLEAGAFVTDEVVLLQIDSAKWLGKLPNRRLVVTAEDVRTGIHRTLTAKKLEKFRPVTPCSDAELVDAAATG